MVPELVEWFPSLSRDPELVEGVPELVEGVPELVEGVPELVEGVPELVEGSGGPGPNLLWHPTTGHRSIPAIPLVYEANSANL